MSLRLVDTDVLIWYLRGNIAAAGLIEQGGLRISAINYLELLHGVRDKAELSALKTMLSRYGIGVLDLTPAITHAAIALLETYTLSHRMGMADALIAATALEYRLPLITSNIKHYRAIEPLILMPFSA